MEVLLVVVEFLPELLEGLEVLGPPAQFYVFDHVPGLVLADNSHEVIQGCDLLSECLLFVFLFLLEESVAHERRSVGHVLRLLFLLEGLGEFSVEVVAALKGIDEDFVILTIPLCNFEGGLGS